MNYIDVTIRESVYLKKGMTEEKAIVYLKQYVKLMKFSEIKGIEICFLDNVEKGRLLYDEEFIKAAYDIVKDRFDLIAVIHPNAVDLSKWDPDVIRLFKTVRFMINAPIDAHAEEIIEYLHDLGVEVSINVIYISRKDTAFVDECVALAHKHNVEYFCFADSCGNCLPADVRTNVSHLKEISGSMKLNYHFHDHFGLALANALECYPDMNVLDCSVNGIGKGGGNLSLENIVFAGRIMEQRPILKSEVVDYAKLLKFLVQDILEEDGEVFCEKYRNLLIGIYNCNLKEADAVEKGSGNDFIKFCELVCEVRESR